MTLDETIKRYIDNAEYERTHGNLQGCLDFRQLAKWLKELKAIKENTPPTDDWEHYADRLHDIAYKNGYDEVIRKIEDIKEELSHIEKPEPHNIGYESGVYDGVDLAIMTIESRL